MINALALESRRDFICVTVGKVINQHAGSRLDDILLHNMVCDINEILLAEPTFPPSLQVDKLVYEGSTLRRIITQDGCVIE